MKRENMISLRELCERLGISFATGKNWLRLGKLTATGMQDGKPCFSPQAVADIEAALADGSMDRLRSRRNKSRNVGTEIYGSYLSEKGENAKVLSFLLTCFSPEWLAVHRFWILRQYAGQLLRTRGLSERLLAELPTGERPAEPLPEPLPVVSYVPYEDFLGALYLSLCALSGRKQSGAYYTPAALAKRLVASLPEAGGEPERENTDVFDQECPKGVHAEVFPSRYLDPCCGTGIFLLQLAASGYRLSQLFGQDMDPVAVGIARINLALTFCQADVRTLRRQIRQGDSLRDFPSGPWPVIVGNPPWGIPVCEETRKNLRKTCRTAIHPHPESCSIILEQSLGALAPGGCLAMVIPEALLTVKRHRAIREVFLNSSTPLQVEYVGEVFDKVICPAVLLTVRKAVRSYDVRGTRVCKGPHSFVINTPREPEDAFHYSISDQEYAILRQMETLPGALTLKDSIFALGIVTGDNQNLLSSHPGAGREPVLRGRDIHPGYITPPKAYLQYRPQSFQQMAREDIYRAKEKFVYAFISDRLCFAPDREGRLTLNSCNLLIPRVAGLSADYILALLNSELLNFYWQKKFSSRKVLRQHLERLPLAPATAEQQREVVRLKAEKPERAEEMIAGLYGFEGLPVMRG